MKIILLPGLDGTGLLFNDLIDRLPDFLDPVVCNYPDDPNMGYEDLYALACVACPSSEPYVVLGESFSGPIAIRIAANITHKPCALILVNTFLSSPRKSLTKLVRFVPEKLLTDPPESLLRFILKDKEDDLQPLDGVKGVINSLLPKLVKARLLSINTVQVKEIAEGVHIPTYVLQAAKDIAISAGATEILLQSIKGSVFQELPGNHFSLQTFPETASRLIGEFVTRNGVIDTSEV